MIRGFNGLNFVVRYFNVVDTYIFTLLLYRTGYVGYFVGRYMLKNFLLTNLTYHSVRQRLKIQYHCVSYRRKHGKQ